MLLKYANLVFDSFYLKTLYKKISSDTKFSVFKYSIFLSFLSSFVVLTHLFLIIIELNPEKIEKALESENVDVTGINKVVVGIFSQIPEITIKRQELQLNDNKDYIIYHPETNKAIGIISANITDQQIVNYDQYHFVMSKNKIIFNFFGKEAQSYMISDLFPEDNVINNVMLMKSLAENQKISYYLLAVFAIFMIFISGVILVLRSAILSLLARLILRVNNIKVEFQSLHRVVIFSMTPVIAMKMIIELIPFNIPGIDFIILFISFYYLVFGIKSSFVNDKNN